MIKNCLILIFFIHCLFSIALFAITERRSNKSNGPIPNGTAANLTAQNVLPLDPWVKNVVDAHNKLEQINNDFHASSDSKAEAEKNLVTAKAELPQRCQFMPADSQLNLGAQLLALDNTAANGSSSTSQNDYCQNLISKFNSDYAKLGNLKK